MNYHYPEFKQDFSKLQSLSLEDFATYFNGDESFLLSKFFFFYFKKKKPDIVFLEKLFQVSPELLIKAVRLHQVPFLHPRHWEAILSQDIPSIPSVQNWIEVLSCVQEGENFLWTEIKTLIVKCEHIPIDELLIYSSWWYESRRLKEFDEVSNIYAADYIGNLENREYNRFSVELFLSYIFSLRKDIKLDNYTQEQFIQKYLELLADIENNADQHLIFDVIDRIDVWYHYKSTILETVCFDFNYNAIKTPLNISLQPISILEATNWSLDGMKYGEIYQKYINRYFDMLTHCSYLNTNTPNAKLTDYSYYGTRTIEAVCDFAKDLCIEGVQLNVNTKEQLPIDYLIHVFASYRLVAMARFTDPVDDLCDRPNNIKNWQDRLLYQAQTALKNGSACFSLRATPKSQWRKSTQSWQDNKGTYRNLSDAEVDCLEQLLIFDVNSPQTKKINRFSHSLDLTVQPFIRVGDFMFCINNILGELERWGFGIIQNALGINLKNRQKISEAETQKMENKLGELFANKGFDNVKYSHKYEYQTEKGKLKGDIDLMVYENDVLVIGELKRTKLRLDLKETWLERWQTNSKGVSQLEKHLYLLELNPQFYRESLGLPNDFDFSKIKIVPLLISTSLEDDGVYFGKNKDIQKINYCEVLWLLRNADFKVMREANQNGLEELVRMIRCRWMWHNLPLEEPHDWSKVEISIPIEKITNSNLVRVYNESTKKANKAYDKGSYSDALYQFKKALECLPNCPYLYESIGNCYSKLRNFEQSTIYYDKAKLIAPEYYNLLWNRVQNYFDCREYDLCTKELLEIMRLYGILPLIRCRVFKYINYLYGNNLMSPAFTTYFLEQEWSKYNFYDYRGCE